MASSKRLAAAFAEEKDEEGQEQNLKRQKLANVSSEETSPDLTIKTANNPKATTEESDFPVNVKAKMPDVPLADKYRGGEFFFVRECYVEYYLKVEALLVLKKKQCVTVTGTPGIGKSIFYAFFVDRFRKTHADWTVIASTYTNNSHIMEMTVFEPRKQPEVYPGATQSKLDEITLRLYEGDMKAGQPNAEVQKKVMWLCDGPPPVKRRQMVVVTSSNEWLRVARNDDQTYYLPPWTLEELQLAVSVLQYPFSDDEIENRFWNFGGVARNFFKLDPVNMKIAIHGLTESIEAITDPRKLENLLLGKPISKTPDSILLYNPKGDGRLYETAIVSDMVREKLSERLLSITRSKLDKVYALLKGIPPAAPLRGWSFENYAHRKLQEAKRLSARSLVQSDRKEVFKMQPSDKIDVFQRNAIAPELLNNGPYHKHQQKCFESIDGFFFPKLLVGEAPTMDEKNKRILLFHMTVSKDHSVRVTGIIYLLDKLGLLDLVKANPKRAALVFVRPTDRSMDFQQQKILSGGTPPKDIRDLKGIGQGTVNILAKYFNVVSTADLEAKVDDFEAGRIVLTDKKHSAAWARAVEIWKREVQYLQDQSNIKMVEEIPQYVYPLN